MFLQRTIQRKASIQGVGLHTGSPISMTFHPAPPYTGICFVRTDLSKNHSLKVQAESVKSTQMATTLAKGDFSVSTVEHCLSVVTACRIDNLIIEIDGPELPICDGSARVFEKTLREAGWANQMEARKYIYIQKVVRYGEGDKYAYISPYNGLRVTCTIDFPHPLIGLQHMDIDISEKSFTEEIAGARTFGFISDFEKLKAQGLARGASLDNVIGLDEKGLVEGCSLRYPDEFVRHKILDALGDLVSLGHPVMGHLHLYRAGHETLNRLIKKILASSGCYRLLERGSQVESEKNFWHAPKS